MNLEIKSYVFLFSYFKSVSHKQIEPFLLDTEVLVSKKNVFDNFKLNELLILKSTIICLAKKTLTKIVFS